MEEEQEEKEEEEQVCANDPTAASDADANQLWVHRIALAPVCH